MPAAGFHFNSGPLTRGEVAGTWFGSRTSTETPGPGAYEPFPFLTNPVKRALLPCYLPETTRHDGAEPFSLSRPKSQQLLIDYAATDFFDLQKEPDLDKMPNMKRGKSLPKLTYLRSGSDAQRKNSYMGWRAEKGIEFRMMQTPEFRFSPLADVSQQDYQAEVQSVAELENLEAFQEPREQSLSHVKSPIALKLVKDCTSFLRQYQKADVPTHEEEARLAKLINSTAGHCNELQQRTVSLQKEASDAEDHLKTMRNKAVNRMSENKKAALTSFQKMQQRTLEDKMEEDLQRGKDQAQHNYSSSVKRLNHALVESQDFRVIHRELERMKIEKLSDALKYVSEGRLVRSCIRGLIQHGAEKLLLKLDVLPIPLETWMKEVLINMSYLELKIEEAEDKIAELRQTSVGSTKSAQDLLGQTCEQRVENLKMQNAASSHQEALTRKRNEERGEREGGLGKRDTKFAWLPGGLHNEPSERNGGADADDKSALSMSNATLLCAPAASRVSHVTMQEMQDYTAEIKAYSKQINEMKWNVASVTSQNIIRAKRDSREKGRQAERDGIKVLVCLTSEEFAKFSMREMQKTEEKEVEHFKTTRTVRLNGPQLSEFRNLASSHQQIASAHTAMQSRQSGMGSRRRPWSATD